MIAIDLETALGTDAYVDRLEELVRRLAALEMNPGAEPARYPGERRWRLRRSVFATAYRWRMSRSRTS